ncbi:hypothetical protein C0992_008268 [Termitomyces sp. T32_za158]|nr:hypothetical protein C0992_008268 [Termitomyces sp. T32_za158]
MGTNLSELNRGAFVREVIIEPQLVQPSLKPSYKRGASLRTLIFGRLDTEVIEQRLEKDIRCVTDAISAMPHLYKYSLGWEDDLPYHPEFYRAFLTHLLPNIKGNLHSLVLNVPPEMLHVMPSISMPCLESLRVELCTKKKSEEEIDRIFDSFVVFVNNLLGSLESLWISSRVPSRSLKLDRFFRMLGTFPHLRSFTLSIPFDGSHLSSPDQVVKFLNKHRHTLKHLRLDTGRCSPADSPTDPEAKFWIPNILTRLNATPYTQLYDLRLAIRPIKMDLTPLMKFFELHALNSLTLTERALSYNEIQAILEALRTCENSHGLKQLRLRIEFLSPDLLELFAKRIPRLVLLDLTFGELRANGGCRRHFGHSGHMGRDEFVSEKLLF